VVIENDYVTNIEGDGLDAALLRSYRKDINGTELRAFAGNFLCSTGATRPPP
jgi:hypothetical protein